MARADGAVAKPVLIVDLPRADNSVWLALVGACLCMFCGQAPVAMYTFGVFVPEIVKSTDWPPSTVASAIGPGALLASLLAPLVGAACDRFGTRTVALIGGPAFGLGLALVGIAPASAAGFVLFTILMWLLSITTSPVPYAQMLSGMVHERRGLALSLMFAAAAVGIAAWPPYVAVLIKGLGWRGAYVGLGLTVGSIIFVAALTMLRNVRRSAADAGALDGLAVRDAVRTARFWKIVAVFTILTGVLSGVAVNLPVMLRKEGVDAQAASLVMTIIGFSMLIGRLAMGIMLDKWFSPHVAIATVLLPATAFLILCSGHDRATIYGIAALVGFGLGSEFNAAAFIVGRAFGLKAYGMIYWLITMFCGFGSSSGPALLGMGLARDLSPPAIFGTCLVLLAVAVAMLATLKQPDLPF